MNTKEFRKLQGWIDYERHRLHDLNKEQEILYFEKRLKMILLIPANEMYKSIMRKRKNSSAVLCFGTCICCAIEALGKFHTGVLERNNGWKNFESWIKSYMDKGYFQKHNNDTYARILWDDFRNGLAHGFTIKNGGFEEDVKYFKLKSINGIMQLEIDPKHFYEDFRSGVDKYIDLLKKASISDSMYLRFNHAFRGVFILGL
ncbi:hypothetical protein HZB60_06235 [candidate division KSB1 bacterium]|nr:hypothetical protein [candidate division KSB1 bacterium]